MWRRASRSRFTVVSERFFFVPVRPVFVRACLRDAADFGPAPIRQEQFQPVDVIRPGSAFSEETCREFAEGHLRLRISDAETC
jgi:hypothetical protein